LELEVQIGIDVWRFSWICYGVIGKHY